MKKYTNTNTVLKLFAIGIITFFSILSFSDAQAEVDETTIIDSYFADFENLNQYQQKDTIAPNVVTYSQLKNFNEKDNYLNNKKDISNRVTTYSKSNISTSTPKKIDISNRVTSYSSLKNKKQNKAQNYSQNKKDISKSVTSYSKINNTTKVPKKYDNSSRVKTHSALKKEDENKPKTNVKPAKKALLKKKKIIVTVQKSSSKKNSKPKKKNIVSRKKIVVKKQVAKKTTNRKEKKGINSQQKRKKSVKKPISQKTKNINKTTDRQIKFQPTKMLHYNTKELNTATNINLIESAPVYPNCLNKITENDKKACLLTNVSQFVLDNFNNALGKKAGLKKGFYEIRVLFIIDKTGKSKTYKVLGKFSPIIKNEIKRIINKLPKMIPGKSNGKNVPVKYSVKVLFEIK